MSFLLGENRGDGALLGRARPSPVASHAWSARQKPRYGGVCIRHQEVRPSLAQREKRLLWLKRRVALKIAIWAELVCRYRLGRRASMTNDPYPAILSPDLGIPLSLALNFGAPVVAWLLSRELKRHRWWPHAIACFWEISSLFVFATLLLPTIPADEAPGPADGLLLIPTAFSAAVVLLGYCIMLLFKFIRWSLSQGRLG
jgi:hypothetical protein